MKQGQIIGAYVALERLMQCELPARNAFQIMMARQALEPGYKCCIAIQQKTLEKYAGVVGTNGVLTFPSIDAMRAFEKDLNDLLDTDVDIQCPKATVRYDDIEGIKMRPNDMSALIGIVTFEEERDK